jgi:TatD DNase family protein
MSAHKEDDLAELSRCLERNPSISAVGEIGLDLFIENADLTQQLAYLRPQLALAKQHDLPVLLHVRKAHDPMLKELRQYRLPAAGFVHAFSGSEQQAEQYLKLGFKLGIGGTLTYERARKLRRIVQRYELSSFVLETDAPDMPLSAHRGDTNLPERVVEVAEVMAGIKGCSLEEVAALTTASAKSLLRRLT